MTDADWAKFINEDLCPGMAKRLSKEKSYQENVSIFLDGFCHGKPSD